MPDFVVSTDTGLSNFFLRAGETGIILASGAITAPLTGNAAVTVLGAGANIANYGALASPYTFGIEVNANATRILNAGLIGGVGAGIGGTGNAQIDNSGYITALAGANARAISLAGGGSFVANSGTIVAISAQAIFLGGATPSQNAILNTGIIRTGGPEAILFGAGTDTLTNTGTVVGNIGFGDGSAYLINSGLIDGNVSISRNATALYDLRDGGSVTGTLTGGDLNDTLRGGQDADRFNGGTGNDLANGSGGNDTLNGDGGNDTLRGGSGDDAVLGGTGSDSIDGGGEDDSLSGGNDTDRLRGGSGDDSLSGDAGADTITGGSGDDAVIGGSGQDRMTGGSGSDVFVFVSGDSAPGSPDTITDFGSGQDQIDLQGVSAQVLAFRGTGAFAGGGTGSVTYSVVSGSVQLSIDANGDSLSDLQILLSGVSAVNVNSFLL